MLKNKLMIFITGFFFFLTSCLSGLVPISKRPVVLQDKIVPSEIKSREEKKESPPQTFIKKSHPVVKKKQDSNMTGSLFDLSNSNNYLFVEYAPVEVGSYLTINFKKSDLSSRDKAKEASVTAPAESTPKEEVKEPVFTPLEKIKMKVSHNLDNGDVVAFYERESNTEHEGKKIKISARVPLEFLTSSRSVSSENILDVYFVETDGKEVVERSSFMWEPEYLDRLSLFAEAKTKEEFDLDKKMSDFNKTKESFLKKQESLGKEKQKLALERDKLYSDNASHKEKVKKLEEDLKQQVALRQQQEELVKNKEKQIEDLTKGTKPPENVENKPPESSEIKKEGS